jgi:hypothetical protein
MTVNHCYRCGEDWKSRKAHPDRCGVCGSKYWDHPAGALAVKPHILAKLPAHVRELVKPNWERPK